MNDAADEPSKPTSAEPVFRQISREISDEELQRILGDHKKWVEVEAEDRTGLDRLRADLSRADLRKRDLRDTQLQGANLQGAKLLGAQLQGADLYEAQLQGANLRKAQLQKAYLREAQLRGAYLRGANFEQLTIKLDGEPGYDLPAATSPMQISAMRT
jgi:uncharacterized protein YjbI with pentapeptide repeats